MRFPLLCAAFQASASAVVVSANFLLMAVISRGLCMNATEIHQRAPVEPAAAGVVSTAPIPDRRGYGYALCLSGANSAVLNRSGKGK
jgi:hypothetical protein